MGPLDQSPIMGSRPRKNAHSTMPPVPLRPKHGQRSEKCEVSVTVSTRNNTRNVPAWMSSWSGQSVSRHPRQKNPREPFSSLLPGFGISSSIKKSRFRTYFANWKLRSPSKTQVGAVESPTSADNLDPVDNRHGDTGAIPPESQTQPGSNPSLTATDKQPPKDDGHSQSTEINNPTGPSKVQDEQSFPFPLPPSSTTVSNELGTKLLPLSSLGKELGRFHGDLFYALSSAVPLPHSALQQWDETRKRLWEDLSPARSRIRRHCSSGRNNLNINSAVVELELRMSGHAKKGADSVECSPTIWVLCGSKQCKQEIQSSVRKLSWLQRTSFSLEIHVDAPRFAAIEDVVSLDRLPLEHPINLPNGDKLYLHVETLGNSFSANGKMVCATLAGKGGVVDQRFSRLGGFVLVNKQIKFGITTAHGFAHFLSQPQPESVGADIDTELEAQTEEDDCCDSFTDDLTPSSPPLGRRCASTVEAWIPLLSTGMVNFLGQGATALESDSAQWRPGKTNPYRHADFALLGRFEEAVSTNNCYQLVNEGSTNYVRNLGDQTLHGSVHILTGERTPLSGYLLDQESSITIGDITLKTRKIELPQPLASGTSGSWVVQGETLCGMIIAVYDNQPFAHIVEASQLFSDIKKSCPDAQEVAICPTLPGLDSNTRPSLGFRNNRKESSKITITLTSLPQVSDPTSEIAKVADDVEIQKPGKPSLLATHVHSKTDRDRDDNDSMGKQRLRSRVQGWFRRGASASLRGADAGLRRFKYSKDRIAQNTVSFAKGEKHKSSHRIVQCSPPPCQTDE